MPSNGKPGGWTIFRVIGMAIAVLGMVGFGLCSAFGLIFAIGGAPAVLILVLVGVAAAVMFFLLARHITRLVDGDYEKRDD